MNNELAASWESAVGLWSNKSLGPGFGAKRMSYQSGYIRSRPLNGGFNMISDVGFLMV